MTNPTQPMPRDDELPHILRTVIEIAAPPERVFEALTDARELATWWGGDDARAVDSDSDPHPGGDWHVRTIDRDGTERSFGGEYRIVDPPHRLEQTWRASDDPDMSIVRYDLEPVEIDGSEGTRLTVTHTEPLALAALTTIAMRTIETRPRLLVTSRIHPAWMRAPQRTAWSSRLRRHKLTR